MRGRLHGTLLTGALVALAVAGCGGDSGSGSGDGPAELVPRDAAVYFEATVRPEGDLREDALAAAGKILDTSDPGPRITELLQEGIASGGDPKLDYARDIEPWLGDRAAVWATGGSQDGGASGGEDAEGLALVATTDADLTREKVRAALDRAGKERTARSYEGVDYEVDGDGDVFAIVEDYAAFGSEAELKRTIDASKGESLAEAGPYRQAMERLPQERLGHVFLDFGRFMELSLASDPTLDPQAAEQIDRILDLKSLGVQASALVADGDRVVMDSVNDMKGNEAFRRLAFLGGAGEPTPLTKELPGDSWLAMGVPEFGSSAKFFYERAVGAFGGAAIGEQVRRATGLDLEQDVFGWMGDVAFFVRGERTDSLDGGAVFEVTDESRGATAFGKLVGALRVRGGFTAEPVSIEGAEDAFALNDGTVPKPIVMARSAGRIAVTYGEDAAAAAFGEGERLGDSDVYAQAKDVLGGEYEPSLLLSWANVMALIDEAGDAGPEWAKVKPYLDAMTVIASGGKIDGDRMDSRFGVGLR